MTQPSFRLLSRTIVIAGVVAVVGGFYAAPANASFHIMTIEQVIGGVQGNTNAQAIQLRMRLAGQNEVGGAARLVVRDAAGANPVTIIAFATDAADGTALRRILIASPQFITNQMPPGVVPDFTMTNLIPPAYLAAGSLTFEDVVTNGVLWRLSWGGAGYTGSNAGTLDNDGDGDFGPPFGGALPSTTNQALLFTGPAGGSSTTNLLQYAVTAGSAVFENNAQGTGTVPVELQEIAVE